jgi:hypothetical protein
MIWIVQKVYTIIMIEIQVVGVSFENKKVVWPID